MTDKKPDWKQEIISRVWEDLWNDKIPFSYKDSDLINALKTGMKEALNLAEEHFTKRIDTLDLEVENSYLEEISRLQAENKELKEKVAELRHELTLCRKKERDKKP